MELKDAPEEIQEAVKGYENVEDLAKAHVELNKMLSSRIDKIEKEDTFEEFSKKAQMFGHLSEENYGEGLEGSDELKKLGFKYKLHPEFQLKQFVEEYDKMKSEALEQEVAGEMEKWKAEGEEMFKNIEDKDIKFLNAVKRLEMEKESFDKEYGELAKNPKVLKLIYALGTEKESDKHITLPGDKQLNPESKLQYVKKHMHPDSPYFNKKHANHASVKAKVDQYTAELSEEEQETGVGYGSEIF